MHSLFSTWRVGTASKSFANSWETQWTEEPSGLQSIGSQRVGHDWVTYHAHLKILWRGQVSPPLAFHSQERKEAWHPRMPLPGRCQAMPPRLTPLCSPPGSAERERRLECLWACRSPGRGPRPRLGWGCKAPLPPDSSNSRGPRCKRVEEACGGGGWEAQLPRV